MKKFIALFDLHFGFEFANVKGQRVKRSTHNLAAVQAVMRFAEDFGPDIVILGGDQLNCGPVSHWHKGKPRLDEGFKLKEEYKLLNDNILQPFKDVERKIWLTGNHEQWIEDFLNENPGLEGLLEPKNFIGKEWEYYSQGEIVKIGKLHFTHGDTILGGGKYVNPAQHLVNQTRVNIRCGHLHTYFAATDINPIDGSDYHSAIVVPGMCATNPSYVKNRPTRFITGFLYGYIQEDGNFNDTVVILNDNSFVVNGKEYKNDIQNFEKVDYKKSDKDIINKYHKFDPLFENAKRLITSYGKYSTSYLQTKLSIGFPRAFRLTEQLRENKVL